MSFVVSVLFAMFAATAVPSPKQHWVSLAIKTGDPYGSEGAGTIKVLSRSVLLLKEKQEGFFQVGHDAPTGASMTNGIVVRTRVETLPDGKLHIDGSAEISTFDVADDASGVNVTTRQETVRTSFRHNVLGGETVRVRISKTPAAEMWAELTITDSKATACAVGDTLKPVPAMKPRGSMTVSLGYSSSKGFVVNTKIAPAMPAAAVVPERVVNVRAAPLPFAVTRVVAPQPMVFVSGMPMPAGYVVGYPVFQPAWGYAQPPANVVRPGIELRRVEMTVPAVPATSLKTLTGRPVGEATPAEPAKVQWPVFATPNK